MTPVEEPAAAPPTPQGPTSPKVSSTIPRRPNLQNGESLWSSRLPGGGVAGWGPAAHLKWRYKNEALESKSWTEAREDGKG